MFQPYLNSYDGANVELIFPDELFSFQVFHNEEHCKQWLEENGYDLADCHIEEYDEGDIEEPMFLDD